MREIKFRAWDKKKNKFISPANIAIKGSGVDLTWSMEPENKNIVFLQFTGLTDKNGKEIYEGDIIDIQGPGKGIIRFNNGGFYLKYLEENEGFDSSGFGGPENTLNKTTEIIGNIYENPELLKQP